MNSVVRTVYEAFWLTAAAAAAVIPKSESKTLRSLRARHGILRRFAEWGETKRDTVGGRGGGGGGG
ncbi:MAG: hypothetical protein ABR543_15495, partial [Gemmatimonadaceae bacterium]